MTDRVIAYERAVMRAVVNHVATARGLTPPWPAHTTTDLPGWLHRRLTNSPATWDVVQLGEIRQQLIPTHRRGAHGVVYTPPEVVEYMVSAALDAAHLDRLDDHPNPLSQITIVDPACGCGIFPVHVARHLAAWYAAWLVGPNPPTGVITAVMPLVMHECVYGIDLDPVAVEVARAACWLETGGRAPITFMDGNIIVADALAEDLPKRFPKLAARWRPGTLAGVG